MSFREAFLRALVIAALASWVGVVCAQFFPKQAVLKQSQTDTTAVGPSDSANVGNGGTTAVTGDPDSDSAGSDSESDPDEVLIDWSQTHLSIEQAWYIYEQGLADFVDARSDEEFNAGHILGAFHVSQADFATGNFTPSILEFINSVPPERPLVIYCEGGSCDTSENVAIRLQETGFKKLYIMTDGYPAWVEAGYPVEISDQP